MPENSKNGDLTYNTETGVYATDFNCEKVPPSVAIIEAIAEITDTDTTDLDSLQKVTEVDVDGLDSLFVPPTGDVARGDGFLKFSYLGFHVTVFCFGRIEIQPLDEDS